MQILPVNNNAPNFEANRLRTAEMISERISHNKKVLIADNITIYSINKSDKGLIDNLLSKLGAKNRSDANAVKEKNTVNDTISYVLNKALHLDEKVKDGVYIAVKNDKQITGILDFTDGGIPLLKNLVVWGGGNKEASRVNLFTQFLRSVERRNKKALEQADIFVYAEPKTKGNKWLKESGFISTEKDNKVIRERLKMDASVISDNARNREFDVEFITNMHINKNMKHEKVELNPNLGI